MSPVAINELLVLHQNKRADGSSNWLSDCPSPDAPGFFLDTCIRQLAVPATTGLQPSIEAYAAGNSLELYSGQNAYRFLLEVACGLHSAVPAETNIIGQIKSAWTGCLATMRREDAARLQPLMHTLLDDTQSIRREHLQGLGGSSYGSLARKLLNVDSRSRVLFVGSGELTQSMLPFFRNVNTGLWNYRLPVDAPEWVEHVFKPDDSEAAADWANVVILTTPPDATNDERWQRLLSEYPMDSVLHLGLRRQQNCRWNRRFDILSLDDVFELRQSQSNIRDIQLEKARQACTTVAAERALHSASAPTLVHG